MEPQDRGCCACQLAVRRRAHKGREFYELQESEKCYAYSSGDSQLPP
jgi:hypothetical protein